MHLDSRKLDDKTAETEDVVFTPPPLFSLLSPIQPQRLLCFRSRVFVSLTCSRRGRASESRPDMRHTSPPSRRLNTHTFLLHHTADSPNLCVCGCGEGGAYMDQQAEKEEEGYTETRQKGNREHFQENGPKYIIILQANDMKWINVSLIICHDGDNGIPFIEFCSKEP